MGLVIYVKKLPIVTLKICKLLLSLLGKPIFLIVLSTVKILLYVSSKKTHLSLPKIHLPKKRLNFHFQIPKIHRSALRSTVLVSLLIISLLSFAFLSFVNTLPNLSQLHDGPDEVTTKIYDRNNKLLYKIYKDKNRSLIHLSDVPLVVRHAVLSAEDANFYEHYGISPKGITRAIYKYLRDGEVTGGSTITQQLVKNALLSPEKTIIRKLKELILAFEVEAHFTKDQIFEMYLNEVSYGGTAYGIAEAADVFLGKHVHDLTLSEAAFLAGLPKSPTKYSPYGSNPQSSINRRNEILSLMHEQKFITKQEQIEAQSQTISLNPPQINISAPHFVMYVKEILEEKYGTDVVEKGGLEVHTTLDLSIQKIAEEAVKNELTKLTNYKVSNGASLVLDTKSGEILAMVGSKDYFNTKDEGNVNVLTRLRQPGSTVKIINYAYALSHGYSLASIVQDIPMSFRLPDGKIYTPKNYDGKYKGSISIRRALAESRNIPAVSLLASYGVNNMIKLAQEMGISSWNNPSEYGLSLTLGGGDVYLVDLAQVYATVANYGKQVTLHSILSISNTNGSEIYRKENQTQKQVLDPRVAFLLINALSDNNARSGSFGTRSALVVPNHPEIAVKTGTSNNMRDNLTIGFNQDYVVATWVGNNDNTPMSSLTSGITGAAPIWNTIFQKILDKSTPLAWQTPDGLVQKSSECSRSQEWFLVENIGLPDCNKLADNQNTTVSPQTRIQALPTPAAANRPLVQQHRRSL